MKYINSKYVDLTPEEIAQMEADNIMQELQEKRRPFTPDEVNQMFIKAQINTLEVDDQTALRMMDYYPTFEEVIGQTVNLGFKFTYQGKMYKVIQPTLTISEVYPPTQGTESLYARIDEEHDGDLYDPIPYEGNMALENGKHYIQSDVTYLCNRDTGNPVYQDLKDLVGIYVELV